MSQPCRDNGEKNNDDPSLIQRRTRPLPPAPGQAEGAGGWLWEAERGETHTFAGLQTGCRNHASAVPPFGAGSPRPRALQGWVLRRAPGRVCSSLSPGFADAHPHGLAPL